MSQRASRGFTLIELMLSMAFVSVLLITIALTVIQMGTIYNRGMVLKDMNQSARDIADDLRRVAASSEEFAINVTGGDTTDYVTIKRSGQLMGGRLCTGSYSYVWNTVRAVEYGTNASDIAYYTLQDSSTPPQNITGPVNFYKVPDASKKYCAKNPSSGVLTNEDIPLVDAQKSTELLPTGDHKIGIESFSVTTSDSSSDSVTRQRLYLVQYTIGSGDTSAMNTDQSACLAPGVTNSNYTYCTVQKFSIVLRAGSTIN